MSSDTESLRSDSNQGTGQSASAVGPAEATMDELHQHVEDLEKRESEQGRKHEQEMASLRQDMTDTARRLRETEQMLQVSNESAQETERLRDELKNLREEASRFSREDDREIRKLKRENEESEQKIGRLNSEVEELRNVIKEYVERINGGQNGSGVDQTSALRQELRLVREQAETDLKQLRKQLRDRELSGSAETAENEVLRREILDYQRSRDEQERALDEAKSLREQLSEELELRRGEIDRLQRALEIARSEADEHKLRRSEEAESRKQVEGMLQDAQQQVEDLQASANESRFARDVSGTDSRAGGGSSVRSALAGAVLAFILADGLSILAGQGEILSNLVAGEQPSPQDPEITEVQGDSSGPPAGGAVTGTASSDRVEPLISGDTEAEAKSPPANVPAASGAALAAGTEPATGTILQDRLRRGGHGPVMIYVRGGEFTMGQKRDQLATNEGPPHDVRLGRFAISRDEVTYNDYAEFSRATGRSLPEDQGWGGGRRPVINISWSDAAAYASWLSQQSGSRYRLPTEAEWEYAAAGGGDSFYWWGYQLGENNASCFDCGSRWDSLSTAPAGSFKPNPFGLNDTAGNVMEWTQDCYHDSYNGAPLDGSAWLDGGCRERVARGGAYNTPGDSLHTTKRFHYHPDTRLPILGFRVVRELE